MAEKVVGFVLPAEEAATGAPQTFPGLPGEWTPGVPVPWTALGFGSAREAEAAVKAHGAPLRRVASVEVEPEPELVDERLPRSSSPMPGLSAEEFERRLKESPNPVLTALAAGETSAPSAEPQPVESASEEG